MKKLLCLLLVLLALFTTACGSIDQEGLGDAVADLAIDLIEDAITDSEEYPTQQMPEDASQEDFSVEDTEETIQEDTTKEEIIEEEPPVIEGEYYYDVESVVLYLYTYGTLPDNYITKNEARDLGWEGGSVEKFLEGAAIGGDYFGNREELLPIAAGRDYTECDIDTNGQSSRGAKRLVFSNDGLYFYTDDHYESFTEIIVENNEVIYR